MEEKKEVKQEVDSKKEQECCPPFDPKPWDHHILTWKNKKFVKAKVFTLFYMPINFGGVIRKLMKKMEAANAKSIDNICLSDHTSKFNMDIYVDVNKELPDEQNVKINGKFLSRVYEGPFKDTGKWCQDFAEYAKQKKYKVGKLYMWYTTCPKCQKKYGKNYVVIIGELVK